MHSEERSYETVIGLEVHAQLLTRTKLFCSDPVAFGAKPNTLVSPISLGHPGTLPMMNREAVELAVRLGLACGCVIERENYFARKNYFYPDLPKGYQISQHTTPICREGTVRMAMPQGEVSVRLNRIHMEEDAGKSVHDLNPHATCLDFNRAGMPLVEIVTEPDLRSGEEAFAFLTEMRKLLRWLEVCDGNMEEGSLRCDANISVRKKGEKALGTKVEVKNLNSIRHVRRAIELETERLIALLEAGQPIVQETRSFDADHDTTFTLRVKEDADDYRYFPDPDLPPFFLDDAWLDRIRNRMPALPETLYEQFRNEYGLTDYDAKQLTEDRNLASYFVQISGETGEHKALANWLLGPVRSCLYEAGNDWTHLSLPATTWAQLIGLVHSGQISFSAAAQRLLPPIMAGRSESPQALAMEMNLLQDAASGDISKWIEEVLGRMPDKVVEYRKGKKGLIGLFMGEVKKLSKGKADPKATNEMLLEKLNHT